MQKNSTWFYTLYVFVSLLVAPVVRFLSVYYTSYALAGVYLVLTLLSVCAIAWESLKIKRYAETFEFKNPFHLELFSYIASAGLFINFVVQCVLLFNAFKLHKTAPTYILPMIMSGICALISSGYFVIIGFSFGNKNYDFREFRLIHVVPMLWAISCIFNLIELSTGFEKSIDSNLKYVMIFMLVCFFYSFALEIDKKGNARRTTVLFARLYSYFSVLYFVDRLVLVLTYKANVLSGENAMALTGLMLCGFTFFFEKNILHSYYTSLEKEGANKE